MFRIVLAFIASAPYLGSLALKIEGVSIQGNREFLRVQSSEPDNVLICNYTLENTEKTKTITWYQDNYMVYKWGPPEPPTVGEAVDEGEIVLTRKDGFLQFAQLKSDNAGKYRCEVTTSVGETYKSPNYQLLVVDMPELTENSKFSIEDCSITFSWTAPPVYPKPEPKCGVWSPSHDYVLTAPTYQATPYNNGSVAYRVIDEIFNINSMPMDSVVRCELKITKIDDTSIQLLENSYSFPEVMERGCHPLEVGEGIDLEYDNERLTCRAEVRSKDENAPVIARLKCMEGFEPKYPNFASVQMVCKSVDDKKENKHKWTFDDGLSWNHFDNLICVPRENVPERPPSSQNSHEGLTEDSTREVSSGVQMFISPWPLLILVGLTLFSGIVWGLKSHPRNKEPRHMA